MRQLMVASALAACSIVGSFIADTEAARKEPSGTIALDQSDPHLGQFVTFTTTVSDLPGWALARVQVLCYQNGDLVYAMALNTGEAFELGGGSSAWKTNGGPASCVATLHYWQYHPQQIFHPLAAVSFEAAGAI